MGNKEIATFFYWVFKGATLFFLLIALIVFIALISSFVPVLDSPLQVICSMRRRTR